MKREFRTPDTLRDGPKSGWVKRNNWQGLALIVRPFLFLRFRQFYCFALSIYYIYLITLTKGSEYEQQSKRYE